MTETLSHQHYTIEATLGQGGMGAVYLAFDTRLQRQVAIKCIRATHSNLQQQWLWSDAFQEEARLLAQINHPNIVQIYDIIEWDEQPALVMEYVQGQTLLDVLCSEMLMSPALSLATRLDWLNQIAKGLAAAHAKGIIHRDLKPENIMITHEGVVKIMDFGIARHQDQSLNDNIHDSQVLPGEFVGSPGALSPEQALGEPLTTASDIFSFGILAYSLLCGHHPFGDTGDPDGLLQNIIYRAPISFTPLDCLAITTPQRADLGIGILACLNKAPANRPNACTLVFAAALDSSTSADQHSPPTNDTSRLLWIGAALSVVLIFIGVLATNPIASTNSPRFIAILPIQPTSADSVVDVQMSQAIENSVQESLLGTNAVHLVPSEEWGTTQSVRSIAKITGAEAIVKPTADCESRHCALTLTLYTPPAWRIAKTTNWLVPRDRLEDAYYTAWQNTLTLLDFPSTNAAISTSESYDRYLTLLGQFTTSNSLDQAGFDELLNIIKENLDFFPAQSLATAAAENHFHTTGNSAWLATMLDILSTIDDAHSSSTSIAQTIKILVAINQTDKARQILSETKKQINLETSYELQAKIAEKEGDMQAALAAYKSAAAIRSNARNHYDIAFIHYTLGNIDEAKTELRTTLDIEPYFTPALSFLANLSVQEGDFDRAISLYEGILAYKATATDEYNLGNIYFIRKNIPDALKHANNALASAPGNPLHHLLVGEIHLYLDQQAEAEAALTQVLKLSKDSNEIFSLLAQATALVHLKDFQKAQSLLNHTEKMFGDLAEISYIKALLFFQLEQYELATENMEAALKSYNLEWFDFPWFTNSCFKVPGAETNADSRKICNNVISPGKTVLISDE